MVTTKASLPPSSILANHHYDYVDSFAGSLTDQHSNIDTAKVGKAFFCSGPKWIDKLFTFRNFV